MQWRSETFCLFGSRTHGAMSLAACTYVGNFSLRILNLDLHQKMNGLYVSFEVFTAVTMKNAILWDVTPSRHSVNRRFGGTYRLHLQGRRKERKNPRARNQGEPVAVMSIWRHIPEDCILNGLCFYSLIRMQRIGQFTVSGLCLHEQYR
jgi:hypothetical protein